MGFRIKKHLETVIDIVGVGPKAAYQVGISDVAGLGRDGVDPQIDRYLCRRKFYEPPRNGGGRSVDFDNEAMLVGGVALSVQNPAALKALLMPRRFCSGVATFGGRPAGSSIVD